MLATHQPFITYAVLLTGKTCLQSTAEKSTREIQQILKVESTGIVTAALNFWQGKGVLICRMANALAEDLKWTPLETVPGEVHDAMNALAGM